MGVSEGMRPARGRAPWLLVLAFVLSLGACTSGAGGEASQGAPEEQQAPQAEVAFEPGNDAGDVAPRDPVRVTVTHGTITSVALTNPDGKQVEGTLSSDKRSWAVAEPLGYGKTYTWSGTAVNADGRQVPIKGSFATVAPAHTMGVNSNVGDGSTYGIAMPIALTFDGPVHDKAAVEQALKVTTTPETEGSWAWMHGGTSVHWRPKEYWKPGTKVQVDADIYGVDMGEGTYGKNDLSMSFTIGRSQIVKANTQDKRMVVIRDGKEVADYPASFGREYDPNLVTRSGIHVVMSKHSTYFMDNPAYGYEDFEVQWAVRISNNGEFLHSAPWSVGDQGVRNVSHGCINLAPANAKAFFESTLPGDPVEIEGSSVKLSPQDGDYHDWIYSWDEWKAKSALAQ